MILACRACGQNMQVLPEMAGKRLSCPRCRPPVEVPRTEIKAVPEFVPVQAVEDETVEVENVHLEPLEDEDEEGGTYQINPEDAKLPDRLVGQCEAFGAIGVLALGREAGRAHCLALDAATGVGLVGCDETVFVLDLREGRRAFRFEKQQAQVTSLAVSADGRRVLSGDEEGILLLWDLASRRPLRWLEGHEGAVRSAAISPDGRHAASGGEDGVIRLWDLQTGKERALSQVAWDRPVHAVAFSPDGQQLLGAGGHTCTWSVRTGQMLFQLEGGRGVKSAAFSAEGQEIGLCPQFPSPDRHQSPALERRDRQAAVLLRGHLPQSGFDHPDGGAAGDLADSFAGDEERRGRWSKAGEGHDQQSRRGGCRGYFCGIMCRGPHDCRGDQYEESIWWLKVGTAFGKSLYPQRPLLPASLAAYRRAAPNHGRGRRLGNRPGGVPRRQTGPYREPGQSGYLLGPAAVMRGNPWVPQPLT